MLLVLLFSYVVGAAQFSYMLLLLVFSILLSASQLSLCGLGILKPGHRPHVNLVRTIGKTQHPSPGIHLSHREIMIQACSSVSLEQGTH